MLMLTMLMLTKAGIVTSLMSWITCSTAKRITNIIIGEHLYASLFNRGQSSSTVALVSSYQTLYVMLYIFGFRNPYCENTKWVIFTQTWKIHWLKLRYFSGFNINFIYVLYNNNYHLSQYTHKGYSYLGEKLRYKSNLVVKHMVSITPWKCKF